jgi:hypothetical protein
LISYDPSVFREFAARSHAKADWIVFRETVLGTVMGFLVGLGSGAMMPNQNLLWLLGLPVPNGLLIALASGLVGCAIGWSVGSHKAFMLQLQAQTVLCQAQIEENTRAGASQMVG